MREVASFLPWRKDENEHQLKLIEDDRLEVIREHPKLLIILAFGFIFGFGFLAVAIYFTYAWLRGRLLQIRSAKSTSADELVP